MKLLLRVLLVMMVAGFPISALADDYKDGMKAYEQGNIIEALEFFLAQVTEKPDYQKAVDMIQDLLPKVVELRQKRAEEFSQAGDWEKAQKEYKRLEALNTVLKKLVAYDNKVQVVWPEIDVAGKKSEAGASAAESAYQKGVEALKTPGNAEKAIEFFKEARRYDPDYKDSKELSGQALYNDGMALINKRDFKGGVRALWKLRDFYPEGFKDSDAQIQAAIDSAKVKVAIMAFDDLTWKSKFGDVGAILASEIIASGVSANPVFIEFITRDYVDALMAEQNFGAGSRIDASTASQIGKLIGVDVFVFGKIAGVTPNYPNRTTETGMNTGTLTLSDGNTISIHVGWVMFTKKGEVKVSATCQIVEVGTGKIIDASSHSKTATDYAQWISVTGDERALDPSLASYNRVETDINPPEMLVNTALKSIGSEIGEGLVKRFEE